MNYYGSICLSDIPKRLIRERNGKKYLSIEVIERREVGQYGDTHFVSASCKKDDRIEGENRIIGNLKPSKFGTSAPAAAEPKPSVGSAPLIDTADEVPF